MKLLKIVQAVYVCKEAKPENIILKEINIDSIDFNILIKIVKPRKRDPQLFENYTLNKRQLNEINKFIDNKIVIDFKSFFYLLAREGEYEWDNIAK